MTVFLTASGGEGGDVTQEGLYNLLYAIIASVSRINSILLQVVNEILLFLME